MGSRLGEDITDVDGAGLGLLGRAVVLELFFHALVRKLIRDHNRGLRRKIRY